MAQKIRVFKLAQEFGIPNEVMVSKILDMRFDIKTYMSMLSNSDAESIRTKYLKEKEKNTVEEYIRPTVVKRRQKTKVQTTSEKTDTISGVALGVAPQTTKGKKSSDTASKVTKKTKKAKKTSVSQEVFKTGALDKKLTVSKTAKKTEVKKKQAVSETKPEAEVLPTDESLTTGKTKPDKKKQISKTSDESEIKSLELPVTEPDLENLQEDANRPQALRPASEAPTVKRKVPKGKFVKPKTSPAPLEQLFVEPVVPSSSDKHEKTPRRRRHLESREIKPSKRFSGTGKGKFGTQTLGRKRRMAPGQKGKTTQITTPKASKRIIRIEEEISLQELAKKLGIKVTELLTSLIGLGVGGVNINSTIDSDTAKLLASDHGYEVENIAVGEDELLEQIRTTNIDNDDKNRKLRPPVVTMMGHVDHGKTSLLDSIRQSNVASSEAGGITQHIGAYKIKTDVGEITFIDTPGHAAFTAMRSRGANVTDIVILVVAADDGVMPQTIEAINHAKSADVPLIVAINKCDVEGSSPDRVRRMLMEHNIVPEELGGDTIICNVSAKTKEGIDKLLEMISLQAEISEIDANPQRPANGVVLEAYLDKGRGPVANILVKEGTLKTGDILVAGSAYGRIRAMNNEHGKPVSKAEPSTPVEVLGLSLVPQASEKFDVVKDMKLAEKVTAARASKTRSSTMASARPSLDNIFKQMQNNEQAELNLIIKTDVQGSLEAISDSMKKQSTEKVKISIVHQAVGGITESDVLLASASGSLIIGFNVRPAGKAKKTAEQQNVEILIFSIIYDLLDAVKNAMLGLLAPSTEEEIIGKVEIRETFRIPKAGTIAGSYVIEGKITRKSLIRLIRDSVQIWEGKVESLRRFKDDAKEVAAGFECGIGLSGYNDIKKGDELEVFIKKEVKTTLE